MLLPAGPDLRAVFHAGPCECRVASDLPHSVTERRPHLRAHTTGSFAVYSKSDGKEVTPRGRKARALLAYLVSDPGTKMPKDRMASLLWGDRGDAQARSSLRQVLVELRAALNGSRQVIFSDREHIWIAPDCFIEDPVSLEAERKDAFEDLDNITAEFDDWLAGERTRRAVARMAGLKVEAEELLAQGLGEESSVVIDQMQTLDRCNEDALRLGMEAEFQCADPVGITKRYRAMAAFLKAEMGVEPSIKTRALRDKLLGQLTAVDHVGYGQFLDLYEKLESALKMGAWECDLESNHLRWSPGTFDLFGIPRGASVPREEVLQQYEPNSRRQLEIARAEAIRNGTGFSIEVDVFTRAGIKNRLRINAAVIMSNGTPVRIHGTKQLVR